MNFGEHIKQSIHTTVQSSSYKNHLDVRDRVIAMMDEMQAHNECLPSDYWAEELSGIDYMFDASPLVIGKLREHCHHLTGIRAYEYREHHSHRKNSFAQKLRMLQQQDGTGLQLSESPALGGFGYAIDGGLYNLDTLKFYECLIAMDRAGILGMLRAEPDEKHLVMEIGAGWGGFAWQFKTLFSNTSYVIIDLPPVLLFSAVYLKTQFPSATVFVYGDKPLETLFDNPKAYDFIFLPHYLINELKLGDLYLTINLVSFQEMTSGQVETYVKKVAQSGCPFLYSLNRDRSRHNTQLTTVSSIIDKYYDMEETRVLDMAYVDLPRPVPQNVSAITRLRGLLKRFAKKQARKSSDHRYRHIVGKLNP